jgi:hypothetical protein
MKTRALAVSGLTAVLMGSGFFVSAMPASAQVGAQGGNGDKAEHHAAAPAVAYRSAVPAVERYAAIPSLENQAAIPAGVRHPAIPAVGHRDNLFGGLALTLLGGATLLRKRVTSNRE